MKPKKGHRWGIEKLDTGEIVSTHTSIWAAKAKMWELTNATTQESNDKYGLREWRDGQWNPT